MKQPLIVANWKMHGTEARSAALARGLTHRLGREREAEIVIAPPFTALSEVREATRRGRLKISGQNIHWEKEGPFTGEVSAEMLRDLGCAYVIVGHSERRRLFGESDEMIAKKLAAALRAGLRPILCVGESLEERRRQITARVIGRQLRTALKGLGESAIGKIDIAYEPIWAIGTGRNATAGEVGEAHRWIRKSLGRLHGKNDGHAGRILYGGSVRSDNAAELAAAEEVHGLLVGGASLKIDEFVTIVRVFTQTRRRSR
jgi:triosephosphate isomerase